MEARTLLAVLVLQFSLVALGGGAAERCAQPGALRCEEGRHQSVCLERSRVWHRVRDCAASGGFCAHGRCVGGADRRAAQETCSYPTDPKCSLDCTGIVVCNSNNIELTVSCGTGQLCDKENGVVQCVASSESKCNETFLCTVASNIPDLNDPSLYYECSSSEGNAVRKVCAKNEGFFNPCSGSCDSNLQDGPRYEGCDPTDNAVVLFTNPSLYFVCIGNQRYWNKCEKGYFDVRRGTCTGSSVYCADCK